MKKLLGCLALASAVACGGGFRKYPLKDPVWHDPDRRPFKGEIEEYFSPFMWDGANQTIFRPISRFFAIDPSGESVNVNSMDEVPNSSWFENRIGRTMMTPEEVALGPCVPGETDPVAPWTVIGAKPNGANPGFIIKDAEGKRYLAKFDGVVQGARATSADTIVSKIYHAAGYTVPCNQIVFFDRSILSIDPEASGEDSKGEKEPLTNKHLDVIFDKAMRLPDGRYRASTSLFLKGKPIGPFTYDGRRSDDPNDVIDHEHRRELRGSRMLAAWTNHFDAREQNTLAMWIETSPGEGFVKHNMIDFGDCFGSIWEPPMLGRRIGNAYYLDFSYLAEDFITFGFIERPWDTARFAKTGPVLGYYDIESFDPEGWRSGYPNPAFSLMTEHDGAWMARIIAQFSDEHVRALIGAGRIKDKIVEDELIRIVIGRRDKLLRRYLGHLSPLTQPKVEREGASAKLCLEDRAVIAKIVQPAERTYSAAAWATEALTSVATGAPAASGATVCVSLPPVQGASAKAPRYLIVDIVAASGEETAGPARVHLYHLGGSDYRVVALERPTDSDAPG